MIPSKPRIFILGLAALLVSGLSVFGGDRGLVDTTRSADAKLYMPDMQDVKWTNGLWADRFQVCRDHMIPYMWGIFQSVKESGEWANLKIAAGEGQGLKIEHHGPPFNDGDFFKWFEAVAQMYAVTHDPKLDALMDKIIAVVAKAQRPDGYLSTQTIIEQMKNPNAKRFADRNHFETYNMGHLITAACIHYRATGKTSMLKLAEKAADYLYAFYQRSSPELARNAICPSHYMAVASLYRTTHNPKYLYLLKKLIEIRDLVTDGTDQNQDRIPFRDMTEAVGHAVRANYLYAGVADLVAETGDQTLLKPLMAISHNVQDDKLYITGMTGALYDGASPDGSPDYKAIGMVHQAYGRDYQLPNLTAYNESCATVGYALWNWRMLAITGNANFADLLEQSLYNGILGAINLEGDKYFYANALRKLHGFKVPLRWSRDRMPNIPSSFCCPPNIVRTIAEAQNYIYGLSKDTLWVNLYGGSTLDTKWIDGGRIKLRQVTNYPWNGAIKFDISEIPDRPITFKFRIPGWSKPGNTTLSVNGNPVDGKFQPGTYFALTRQWKAGDTIELNIKFQPTLWQSNPLVEDTLNQVAVRNGPIVYCLESNDIPKGVDIENVALSLNAANRHFTPVHERIVNQDLTALSVPALEIRRNPWPAKRLYRPLGTTAPRKIQIKLIPYFAWDNRGNTEMSVWLPVR